MGAVRNVLMGTPGRKRLTLLVMALVLCAITLELGCQVMGFFVLRKLEATRHDPTHYYQPSDDPTLAYELKHDFSLTLDGGGGGRRLHINKAGFREDSDSTFADKTRVAVLGDSVTFGMGLSQDETIPAQVQKLVDPNAEKVRVLNCGVPGLGLGEFPAFLAKAEKAYQPQAVVYVLNPNDFALRDSVYEGADNGLYRQYRHPWLKSPWMIRKVIYRMKKGGDMVLPSTRWYAWMFDGTKGVNLARIAEMKRMCDARRAKFAVALMAVNASYFTDDRTMQREYDEIKSYLKASGIEFVDSTDAFAAAGGAKGLIDETDHYTAAGCAVMAKALKPVVEKMAP